MNSEQTFLERNENDRINPDDIKNIKIVLDFNSQNSQFYAKPLSKSIHRNGPRALLDHGPTPATLARQEEHKTRVFAWAKGEEVFSKLLQSLVQKGLWKPKYAIDKDKFYINAVLGYANDFLSIDPTVTIQDWEWWIQFSSNYNFYTTSQGNIRNSNKNLRKFKNLVNVAGKKQAWQEYKDKAEGLGLRAWSGPLVWTIVSDAQNQSTGRIEASSLTSTHIDTAMKAVWIKLENCQGRLDTVISDLPMDSGEVSVKDTAEAGKLQADKALRMATEISFGTRSKTSRKRAVQSTLDNFLSGKSQKKARTGKGTSAFKD